MKKLLLVIWLIFAGFAVTILFQTPLVQNIVQSPCYDITASVEDAIADCTLVIDNRENSDKTHVAALLRRSDLYLETDEIPDAYDDLRSAVRISDDRQIKLRMVDVAVDAQSYGRALGTLSDLILNDTNDLEARTRRALVNAVHVGRLDAAKVDIDFVLLAEAENAEALAISGYTHDRRLLDAHALEKYEAALALDPENELAKERAEILREELTDSRERASIFEGPGGRDIPNVRLGLGRGLRFLTLGDTTRALDDMGQILAIEPDHFEALFTRVKIYYLLGDHEGVIAASEPFFAAVENRSERYENYLRAKRDDAKLVVSRANLMAGNAYQQTGRAEQAEQAWRMGIDHLRSRSVSMWQMRLQAAGLFDFPPNGIATSLFWRELGTCARTPAC